jgi:hypothetical protein
MAPIAPKTVKPLLILCAVQDAVTARRLSVFPRQIKKDEVFLQDMSKYQNGARPRGI